MFVTCVIPRLTGRGERNRQINSDPIATTLSIMRGNFYFYYDPKVANVLLAIYNIVIQ